MKPESGYLALESTPPLRGLATSSPSNKINSAFSPRMLNMLVRNGIAQRRAGGVQLGQQLVGEVRVITEFGDLNDDPYCLVLTTLRQYIYDPGTEKFVDLTPNKLLSAIVDASGPLPSWLKVAGNLTATFTVGRIFSVEGGSNAGVYTVSSVLFDGVNTKITVSGTISTLGAGGDAVTADDLTTEASDLISFVSITDTTSHRFLFTNGRDAPRTWDGDPGNDFTTWSPTYTGFVTCRLLCVFAEHLILADVTLASAQPLLVAWSRAGDFDDFESGDSGSQLLYSLKTRPKTMRVLGDRLVIYSSDSIITSYPVGLPAVFQFELVIPDGVRLAGGNGIVSVNVGHIYLAEENIYLFDGSRGLRVLGDAIFSDLKLIKNQEILYSCASLNDYSKRTLFFSVPDIDDGTTIYTAEYDVYNLSELVWGKEKYHDLVSCWGFFVNRDVTLLWEDASWEAVDMTWTEEAGNWQEESEVLNFPIRSYGTPEGRVILVTEGVLSDRTTTFTSTYETKDFEIPEVSQSLIGRWVEIEAEMAGSQVTIEYSTDRGQTFSPVNDNNYTTLVGVLTPYQIPIDVTARTLRVRFSSSSSFQLSWVRVWVKPGGPQ